MLISEKIYSLMKEKGISQMEFAKRTGISQSTISDWRRKGTNPSADKIMVICKVLDISPYELLSDGNSKNKKRHQGNEYVFLDKKSKEYQVLEMLCQLNESKQDRLIQYMMMLKKEE